MSGSVRTAAIGAAFLALASTVAAQDAAKGRDAPWRAQLNALSDFDPSTLRGFTQRPLFSPSRAPAARPPKPRPKTVQPAAKEKPLKVKVLGIVSTGNGLVARVVDGQNGQAVSLRYGDVFGSWTVASIQPTMLTLARNGVEQSFSVFRQAPASGAAKPAAAPPSPRSEPALNAVPAVRVIPGTGGAPGDAPSPQEGRGSRGDKRFPVR